ncbi:MAG: DUF427 domain-containing protein [Chloroflexota bacterium]|nr:DUF427 domain-containing protein [Chloroflexota bacterium]
MPTPRGITPEPIGAGQESVWDYPRPPRVEPVSERIRVVLGGRTLADSTRALRVLETSHPPVYYVSREDVDLTHLDASARSTFCEWKGMAGFLDYDDGQRRIEQVAWSYLSPEPGYEALTGHVAFYAGKVEEAWLADELATPQPGRFYGGWVTSGVVGPFKGEPGSGGW